MTTSTNALHEYKKEEIKAARQEYDDVLNIPWIQRKKGIPHDWILAPLIVGISAGMIVILYILGNRSGFGLGTQNLTLLICAVIAYIFWFWLPEQIYGIKTRTTRHVFWTYPAIRRAIRMFREPGEKFRKHLPVLIVDEKKYFMVNYHRPADFRKYGFQKRIGIVLLNRAMQVVDNDDLFKKAFLVENLSFVTGTEERTKDLRYIRDKYKLTNTLRESEKILARRKSRYEGQGVGVFWSRLMSAFPVLHDAVDESPTMVGTVHEKIRKALGYSFALEFLYEDALHLHQVRNAFIKYMNIAYRSPLLIAKGNGGMLIISVITEQIRGDRKALLALKKMEIIEDGVQNIVARFEGEGVVQQEDLAYYHRKVELAKKIGWPIAKE